MSTSSLFTRRSSDSPYPVRPSSTTLGSELRTSSHRAEGLGTLINRLAMAFRQRAGWEKPAAFKPHCTHGTMTRVYERDSVCLSCGQPGQFRWLYRCTENIERIVERQVPSLDSSGPRSTNGMDVLERGTKNMRNKPSSCDMSSEVRAKYTPEQLEIIARQRKEVKDVIAREEFRRSSAALFSTTRQPPGFESFTNDSIYAGKWRCGEREVCQYRVCPACRPGCADRAFLSLDAIANGDIPLTAAVGFGFEDVGGTPVFDSEAVKHIGQRGPPRTTRAVPDDSWMAQYMMLMLDQKVGGCSKEAQQPQSHTRDVLPIRGPSRPTSAGSGQTYLELLPSAETTPASRQGEDSRGSLAQHILGSDRRQQRRTRRTRGGPHGANESAPLFHSSGTDDLLTGFDNDTHELTPAPLRVNHGVGVTEESIETGEPDLVTQV